MVGGKHGCASYRCATWCTTLQHDRSLVGLPHYAALVLSFSRNMLRLPRESYASLVVNDSDLYQLVCQLPLA